MKKVVLFPNEGRDPALVVTGQVRALLEGYGYVCVCVAEAVVPGLRCESAEQAAAEAEFMVCIGGDGTILRAVSREYIGNLPIAGVNMGHKGYLAQYEPHNREALTALAEGRYHISRRLMLETVFTGEKEQKPRTLTALNDIVLTRGDQTITLEVRADGETIGAMMADGLLVSTATGSTAYNLSAGGPVMDAEADAMIVTPICPHTIWARSIILKADRVVTVSVERHRARLSADGGEGVPIGEGGVLEIRRAEKFASLVVPEGKMNLSDVRRKLQMM